MYIHVLTPSRTVSGAAPAGPPRGGAGQDGRRRHPGSARVRP